jgi:hypothetical protein
MNNASVLTRDDGDMTFCTFMIKLAITGFFSCNWMDQLTTHKNTKYIIVEMNSSIESLHCRYGAWTEGSVSPRTGAD